MAKSPLKADFVRSILDYDRTTGGFRWKRRTDVSEHWNGRYAGKSAGTLRPNGYIVIQIGKRLHYPAHVLAWLHITGEWRLAGVDHANGVRGDNRWANLRPANASDNACNKAVQRNNKSGLTGVWFNTQNQSWEASISKNGRRLWRRFFKTAGEAAEARAKALGDIHGEFAAPIPRLKRYFHARDHR